MMSVESVGHDGEDDQLPNGTRCGSSGAMVRQGPQRLSLCFSITLAVRQGWAENFLEVPLCFRQDRFERGAGPRASERSGLELVLQ
ncbi:unnamed protein product [Prunus armeniaca]|uniref:Uncharacterized protein n=1 Tax=Prunus armeniaca TaxID=36596 RepID=A0A6J5VWN2_PRUAR|nr:unnamed protein product [Prunus armeniaca]